MATPLLLAIGLSAENLRGARMAAALAKARVREVRPEEYALPLGALCADAPPDPAVQTAPAAGGAPVEPTLVLAHFPPGRLDAVLQALRRVGVRAPLRAVLTPTNAGWTPARLSAELCREREAILAGRGRAHADAGKEG